MLKTKNRNSAGGSNTEKRHRGWCQNTSDNLAEASWTGSTHSGYMVVLKYVHEIDLDLRFHFLKRTSRHTDVWRLTHKSYHMSQMLIHTAMIIQLSSDALHERNFTGYFYSETAASSFICIYSDAVLTFLIRHKICEVSVFPCSVWESAVIF